MRENRQMRNGRMDGAVDQHRDAVCQAQQIIKKIRGQCEQCYCCGQRLGYFRRIVGTQGSVSVWVVV